MLLMAETDGAVAGTEGWCVRCDQNERHPQTPSGALPWGHVRLAMSKVFLRNVVGIVVIRSGNQLKIQALSRI
jgi:hypothetical protein